MNEICIIIFQNINENKILDIFIYHYDDNKIIK